MTLLSISRPRTMSSSANRDRYADLMNRYASTNAGANSNENLPSVNIIEDAEEYRINLAVPGYKKDEISINIDNDQLIFEANPMNEEKESFTYMVKEFSKNPFKRTFTLGKTVDTSKVEAKHNEGILTIVLAKKEEAKDKPPRTIKVS
ncbi:MAG: Hsp20/alpha crystallin family protein [Bacteroidales bacterium]